MDATDSADPDAAAPTEQAKAKEERKSMAARMAKYRMQMERLIHYKKTGTHVRGLTRTQRRVVTNQCATHVLSNGKLYYIGAKKKLPLEVITNEDRAREILHQYHSSDMGQGGHSGIVGTTNKIILHYYWNNINMDIIDFVKNCATCQETKKPQPQPQSDLLSIINNTQTPPQKRKPPRKRKADAPPVDRGTMYTKIIAVSQETQTSAEIRKQNELFLKSLLPSLDQLDLVQTMRFRIDLEQLVLSYLTQACATRPVAAPSMPPQANPAAFHSAWYHNMDRNHSYN